MSEVVASLTKNWQDFTWVHKDIRERAEKEIENFASDFFGQHCPLVVLGAFGAGKTQLLYHMFKFSWGMGVPAFYLTLKDVLKEIKERITAEDLVGSLKQLVLSKLDLIRKNLNNEKIELRLLFLPTVPGLSESIPPSELFRKIGVPLEKVMESIDKALRLKGGVVILVDEVESGFEEFQNKVYEGFRGVADAVCQGGYGIYITFSVGYVSYYELFLSKFGADTAAIRRFKLLMIPSVDPDTLYEKVNEKIAKEGLEDDGRKSNTLWWLSRGKIGWIPHLFELALIDRDIGGLRELESRPEASTLLSEGVRVIDLDSLDSLKRDICEGDKDCEMLLKYLILNIAPLKLADIENLPFLRGRGDVLNRLLDRLWGSSAIICKDLVDVQKAVETFIKDLEDLLKLHNVFLPGDFYELLERHGREALENVLSAFAKREGATRRICIGGGKYTFSDVLKRYIEALFDLVIAYIAENFPTVEPRDAELLEVLYRAQSYALEDLRKSMPVFRNFQGLWNLIDDVRRDNYIVIAPWVVRDLMPLYLWSPLISEGPSTASSLEDELRSLLSVSSYRDVLVRSIEELSKYITGSMDGNLALYLIPVPPVVYQHQDLKSALKEIINSLVSRHMDELYYRDHHLMIVLTSDGEGVAKEIKESISREPIVSLLISKIPRIHIEVLKSVRLSDFIKSLFVVTSKYHNVGLEQVIEDRLPARLRRKVKYFTEIIRQWIDERVKEARKRYEEGIMLTAEGISQYMDGVLETIETVSKRGSKWRLPTKIYSLLLVSLSREGSRDVLERLSSILIPNSLIRVEGLPSIYQEFF
ncbi:MAG: hypothetical protein ABWK00_00825, partial [Desulfurococcaceae archaeon]